MIALGVGNSGASRVNEFEESASRKATGLELIEVPRSAYPKAAFFLVSIRACPSCASISITPAICLRSMLPAGIGSKNAVSKHTFPTGITEGERLIALGSYSAAVAMIAAALEEVIISSLGETRPVKGWDVLVAEAERQGAIGPESQAQLRHIWRLRNIAIHGPRTTTISKADAEAVLRAAKEMILGEASNLRLRRKG